MIHTDKEIRVFSEFFCTSNSHCGENGECNKDTGKCQCQNGQRFDGSNCVGKRSEVSRPIFGG